MNLYQALSIPYIRGAETYFDEADQRWLRRFDYAELDGCAVETEATLEGLRELEIARIARIVELMADGRPVPCPRPPLISADPVLLLRRLDLVIDDELLATDETEAAHSDAFGELARVLADRATPRDSTDRSVRI